MAWSLFLSLDKSIVIIFILIIYYMKILTTSNVIFNIQISETDKALVHLSL
jgi:hypothetical protein